MSSFRRFASRHNLDDILYTDDLEQKGSDMSRQSNDQMSLFPDDAAPQQPKPSYSPEDPFQIIMMGDDTGDIPAVQESRSSKKEALARGAKLNQIYNRKVLLYIKGENDPFMVFPVK